MFVEKALMNQAQRAHGVGVRQFLVELGNLMRQQQAFVHDGARRQRRNIEEAFVGEIRGGDLGLGALADDVELPLQLILRHAGRAANEDLLDVGLRCAGNAADGIHFHRRIAPAKYAESLFARDPFQDAFGQQTMRWLYRQKNHPDAILALGRQRETQLGAFAREKLVWNLDQDASAVAGLRIATASAAVREVDEDLQALGDDVVRLGALDINDEANTAGIVFVSWIVETLLNRESDHDRV